MQCIAGQFCKHGDTATLTTSNSRLCQKCQRPLHHGCAWPLPNAGTNQADGTICPNCWSLEVGGQTSQTAETVDMICNLTAAAPQLLLGPQPLNQLPDINETVQQHQELHQKKLLESPEIPEAPQQGAVVEAVFEEEDRALRHAYGGPVETKDLPGTKGRSIKKPTAQHATQHVNENVRNRKIVQLQKSRMQKEKSKKIAAHQDHSVGNYSLSKREPHPTKRAETAKRGKRQSTGRILQPAKEPDRPPTRSYFIDGVDITKKHSKWQGEERIVTPYKRASAWWLPYHEGQSLDPESDCVTTVGVCNICGSLLQLGVRSGTSSLTRHLLTKHPTIHKKFMEAVKGGLNLADFYCEPDCDKDRKRKMPPADSVLKQDGGKTKKERAPAATSARLAATAAAHTVASRCLDAHVIFAAAKSRPFTEFEDPSFCALRRLVAETALASARGGGKSSFSPFPVAEDLYQVNASDIKDRARSMSQRIRVRVCSIVEKQSAPFVGTLSHWKGRTQHSYDKQRFFHSFSIHWIDNFRLMKAVIGVNMNGAKLDWKSMLASWSIESTPSLLVSDVLSEGEAHVECLDHKFQQIAEVAFMAIFSPPKRHPYGLERTADKAEALEAARHLCHFFNLTEMVPKLRAKQQELQQNTKPLDLMQDLGSQWWSTLCMVERLIDLREALTTFNREPGFGPFPTGSVPPRMLSDIEWNSLRCLRAVLGPIAHAVKVLLRQNTVTSSLVVCLLYEVREQLQDLSKQKSNDKLVGVVAPSVVAALMLEKLHQMGDFTSDPFCEKAKTYASTSWRLRDLDPSQILSHALDPRFKRLLVFTKDAREIIWTRLHAEMVKLGPSSTENGAPNPKDNTASASTNVHPGLGAFARLSGSDDESDSTEQAGSHWKATCEVELSAYKLERGIKFDPQTDAEQDPLLWWSERVSRFPTLWKLCQVYFAMPAVASDRAFCVKGNRDIHNRCMAALSIDDDLECIHWNRRTYDMKEEDQ